MENIVTKAICLKEVDYKENDKLITLFSLEYGIFTAVVKGCKKKEAKLKMAFQPFVFGEYTITDVHIKQVINFMVIDDFFSFTKDVEKYFLGNIILETTLKSLENFNAPSPNTFINLLKTFKAINYEDKDPLGVTIHYLIYLTRMLGYKLNFACCHNCQLPFMPNNKYFDYNLGAFVCKNCKSNFFTFIPDNVFSILYYNSITPIANFEQLKIQRNDNIETLQIVSNNLATRLDTKFVGVENYLKYINHTL